MGRRGGRLRGGGPAKRLLADKVSAALGLGGLDGRAAGAADVVAAVEAARPTECKGGGEL